MSGALSLASQSPQMSDQSTIQMTITSDQEDAIIKVATQWQNQLYSLFSLRTNLERIDRDYMRENDWTEDTIKSKRANLWGDVTKTRNITVPIIMPQVNAALTYLTNVFLTGYPIFPVVADPSNESAAAQIETIVQENATTTGWAQQLKMFFGDGLRYNLHAIECDWQERQNWTIENDARKPNSAGAKRILWNGNALRRLDLYNSFWDPRVPPTKMHTDGEFVGYTELYSRVRFKNFANSLYNKAPEAAVKRALRSAPIQGSLGASLNSPFGWYLPKVNPDPFYNKQGTVDWSSWLQNTPMNSGGENYTNMYSVTKLYARIIPSDYGFRVPQQNTPQVWRFIIVNGSVVMSAERMTNVHNYIPVFFGQPLEDGLEYQTKSFAQNVSDMQAIGTSLWAGYLASKRRLVGDRVLYDPSRIAEKDINSTNPTAKIPVRPSAYGKPLNEAVYPFPFRDQEVDSLIVGNNAVVSMANLINGQNPAQQGQFVKGNKTRHEYDDVMGHGNGQNQSMAISVEYQVFTPMKEVIKLNILQYQEADTIHNPGTGASVDIKPEDLRKSAVNFKVADGLIPSDKMIGDDMLQVALQQIGSSPQLAQGYNLAQAFTYLMKTSGLDLSPFEKSQAQLQYEQALSVWQQAAQEAAKAGAPFQTPMPQPSQQLQQEQQQQKTGGQPSATSIALASTQGG